MSKFAVDWVKKHGGAVKRTYYFDNAKDAKAHIDRMRAQNAQLGYVAKARKTT